MYYDTKESGARIKKLRKKNGMTQEILANELGISREFLCRIENGKKGASVDCFVMLSRFMMFHWIIWSWEKIERILY